MRPAMIRPVSRSTCTVWFRSVRKTRTIGFPVRAVAAQSMRRLSSSGPISRKESKSVPLPRTLAALIPTSSNRAFLMLSSA